MEAQNFSNLYPPAEEMILPSPDEVAPYAPYINSYILQLWNSSGFGIYGDGMIQLVDPKVWNPLLENWSGRHDPTNTVIMLSGFGEIYYHRDLGEHLMEGEMYKVEDISCYDPVTGNTKRIATDSQKFFEEWLCDPEVRAREFKQAAFEAGLEEFGPLKPGEIFYLDPVRFEGAGQKVLNLDKVDAMEHLQFLFETKA